MHTMAGLATCPLSHMIELSASRDIVAGLITRTGRPQLLIRVGRIPEGGGDTCGHAAPPGR